jgi:tRNA(Ile)-lysidine synthase
MGHALLAVDELPWTVGVAVSGGGDSVALLHLALEALRPHGRAVRAVTVDHGLREASARRRPGCRGLRRAGRARMTRCDGRRRARATSRSARGGAAAADRRWRGSGARRASSLATPRTTRRDGAPAARPRVGRGRARGDAERLPGEGLSGRVPLARVAGGASGLAGGARDRLGEDPSNEDPRFDRARARAMMERLGALGSRGIGSYGRPRTWQGLAGPSRSARPRWRGPRCGRRMERCSCRRGCWGA